MKHDFYSTYQQKNLVYVQLKSDCFYLGSLINLCETFTKYRTQNTCKFIKVGQCHKGNMGTYST